MARGTAGQERARESEVRTTPLPLTEGETSCCSQVRPFEPEAELRNTHEERPLWSTCS